MPGSVPSPPAELRARVLAAASAEPVPARSVGRARRAGAVVGGLGVSVAILAWLGGPGGYGRPSSYYLTLAALWLAVGVAGAFFGVARGRSMLGRPCSTRVLVVALVPALLVVTAAVASALSSPFVKVTDLHDHLRCGSLATLMALGPLAAFLFVRRGSDPVAPRVTGAALGTAAGALGALGIELRCSHVGLAHVVLGHVVPVLSLALLGALVAGRVVALRAPAVAPGPRR